MEIEELLEDDFDEASDEADNDYQYLNDPSSTQPSSGPPSTPNSCASSPPVSTEEPISPQRNFYTSILSHGGSTLVFSSGKPYGPKRGPGRPRKEFAPGLRHTKDIRGVIRKCRGGIMKGTKKKFLGKDERNALLALSQENGFLQGPSKSPSDFSGALIEMSGGELIEKTTPTSEDVPYFLEKWPGKVCALCNLGERSQLGQGEMLRLEINELGDLQNRSTSPGNDEKESSATDVLNNNSAFPQFSNRRQKGLNKCKNPVNTSDYVDELEKIGYVDPVELSSVQDSNYYYVHRQCVTWSFGILTDPIEAIDKVTLVISQSLRRKCAYCNHYGASITCKMSCPKVFHFPCVSASGGFQIIQTYASFCKEHLGQVSLVCSDDVNCRSCSMLGDVSNLVMCSICGDHYHGTCIGLAQLPGVRAGWQCVSCRKCQICRTPEVTEGRSLPCEQCHKVYHASCLRPVMSSIPKYGWKCRRCRVCSDCGSRTPGAGASSRWHAHYTVCDSCYQQRNKGFSCPICHRAYRAAAYREMVKCSCCNKFVHNTCDPDADLAIYHARKESNPEYEYICSPCKIRIQSGRHTQLLMRRNSHLDDDNTLSAHDNLYVDEKDTEFFDKNLDFGLGKGKPFSASKIAKKRMGFPLGVSGRAKGKVGFQKKLRSTEFGRKRGPKTKMRGIFGVPGLGLQRPTSIESLNAKNEDEPGIENRLVLCSAKDKFILTQDICVMCGAIGTDHEGCLIACTQCGQCYHPYCVNVKVTKVILKKGWRCLDCTVCEGCGQKNDEARLILCDECDISFHIYCMDPPLDIVPQGNWKCKWCAICQKCGKNSPGKNCSWKNSYSECAPCASQIACAVCSENYVECELIIQCIHCERWLHCKCDSIKNEEEAEKCDEAGYVCILCRPKDTPPPHLMPSKKVQAITSRLAIPNIANSPEQNEDSPILQGLDGTHFLDGVCLSEHGISLIKSLQMEHIRKKRKQKLQDVCINNKDARISAAIESVVAGSGIENVIDDTKVEPLDPKEEAEIYKDGMVWDRSDASPPDGFALCTNEQGVVVLRKKRQRNLQKLGIGGFNVRNRTARKDGYKDDAEEHVDHTSYINDNNPSEKKKKTIRKRHKSKLTETYPAYLQEAFFGKNLLDTNKISFESESSEDDAKSSVSEDKIIKLSPEELKMLDCMKTEIKMEKIAQHDENQPTNKIRSMNTNAQIHKPNIDEDIDNSDQDPLKDILPQDLLDSDLVNSIINDGNELTKASGSLGTPNDERTVTPRKDDLADILNCPNFNLDSIEINSKDVEEIFQDVIDTDAKIPLMEKRDRNVISPKQPAFQTSTSEAEFSTDGNVAKMKPKIVNNFISVAPTFAANANVKLVEQSQAKPNISQKFMPVHDQSSNSPIPFGSCQVGSNWQANTRPCDTSVNQNDEAMSGTPTTQANQKSSERMRRDEDLGKMATISAVLYANTNHPELKQDYPNWPDRCKQIYKRWRALSSEKKAPFLQQARDNRSALRMKKVQQDHEKITTQQKSLKQQEQERQWKQLQAQRAKEQQLQQFTTQVPRDNSTPNGSNCSNSTVSFSPEQNVSIEKRPVFNPIPGTPRPQFNTDIVQSTVYASQIDAYPNTLLPINSGFTEGNTTKQQENKQLRDLLQRQEDAVVHTTQNRTISSPAQQIDSGIQRWNQDEQNITNQSFNFSTNSTFREPFPVATTNRTIKVVGNNNLPRINTASNVMRLNLPTKKPNIDSGQRQKKTKDGSGADVKSSESLVEKETSNKPKSAENIKNSDGEIPDNVTAELEKLEQEENVVMSEVEGVGDILGGLGEDDDDELLNSLTAEMGAADFNILEYADPELDALTDNVDNNLLDRLDFDEGDPDERLKKAVAENKYFVQRHEQMQIEKQALQPRPASGQSEGEQVANIKSRTEFIVRKDQSPDIQRTSNFICAQNFGVSRTVVDANAPKLQDTNFRPTNLPRYNSTITGAVGKVPRANLPPPPPPYPGPPPPYPVNSNVRHNQDQPLLLEDLLEQEKREQQQMSSTLIEKNCGNQPSSTYQKPDARAPTTATQNWRKKIGESDEPKKAEMSQVQFFSASLQPPPPTPPDVIVTEQDRILQINYENWLNNQNIALTNKLKYYEDEVFKLRKIRKSLNSKQRSVKKTGGELSPQDVMDLAKVTSEQAVIQKHLENSRKHSRQHAMLFQEYRSKHMVKVPVPSSSTPSPAQMSSMSPMLSPSTNSQSSMLMQTSPSPLGGHILQCTKSPLHSPSPLISHSPSGISQSPVHQSNSNASPYNTMQSSPRISTPHSHIDENSFSPSATIPSPSSLPGRHASPAPRITSPQNPQNRMTVTQMSAANRIATSPGASFGSSLQSQQQVKYNQDRVRMQMPSQHMHQNISPLGSPQPIVSPTQIHSFANSQEVLQSQRTMHFIQQRQIIQRQHVNQNAMKPKAPTASSPIQTHGMGSSPSSPLLQYNPVQNQSILINSLSNRRPNSENSSNDQYSSLTISHDQILSQNRELVQSSDQHNQQQSHFIRSNSEGSGGGGGLSSLTGGYLPIVEPQGKYGRIRLGLFGGSPMWNISNIRHKINIEPKPRILENRDMETKSGSSSSETSEDKAGSEKKSAETPMGGANILNSGNINVLPSRSNASVESVSKVEENAKSSSHVIDDVVVIDSSPDEKQGIMDYDDFHDKGFVATEVSLNSAAQHIADGDDMTVIESLVTPDLGEIVTSPLESEVTEEYVLFSTDVVDYVDSDDSLKQNTIPQKNDDAQAKCTNNFEKDFEISLKKKEKFEDEKRASGSIEAVVSEKNSTIFTMDSINQIKAAQKAKIPEVKNFATTEDFEAMIDGRSTKEPIKIFDTSSNVITTSSVKTISTSGNFITSNLLTCGRTAFTSVQCNVINANATPSTAVMVTPKKIVADVAQTTAKVSIGNTTISVPLLKNMNLNSAHLMSPEKQTKVTGNINIAKQPTILNVRGQKINTGKIVSLSSLQLKSASNAGNAKIVQATVLSNKIQLPQTTVDGFANIKHSIMQPFSYPKLSSLTVLQDMSLPNKIFEDESISPDSSVEQEESETSEIKDYKILKQEGTAANQIKESSNILIKKEECSEKHTQSDKVKEENFPKIETNSENQKIATRVISIMPQLSPLSQPTELTTNMANVSQQLRTIMSSINSSTLQMEKKSQEGNSSNQGQHNSDSGAMERHSQLNDKDIVIKSIISEAESGQKGIPSSLTAMKVFLTTTKSTGSSLSVEKAKLMLADDKQMGKKTKLVVPSSMFPAISTALEIPCVSRVSPTSTSCANVVTTCNQDAQATKAIILSSSNIKRSKSIDETVERDVPAQISGLKRYSLEVIPNKSDAPAIDDNSTSTASNENLKNQEQVVNGCKTSNVTSQNAKPDESQNVLLKQLLQNSTASTSAVNPQGIPARKVPALRAPSLGVVSSLEAQLARPVIPPVPTSPPSLLQSQQHMKLQTGNELNKTDKEEPLKKVSQSQVVSRETSFVSNPVVKNLKQSNEKSVSEKPTVTYQDQQRSEHVTVKLETFIDNNKTDRDSNSPLVSVKKEANDLSLISRLTNTTDDSKSIKREFNESPPLKKHILNQPSCVSQGDNMENCDISGIIKEEKTKVLENFEANADIKKKKKREYQKNRRQQLQMMSKETTHLKKRSRKLSKFDEDYDNFIDNLMIQLRQMPQMQVLEPLLSRNYGICPPYGAGDLSKVLLGREQNPSEELLHGEYGMAKSKNYVDYYNTKPFGSFDMPPEPCPTSMHNGFYDQEFPPIKFESDFDQGFKFESSLKDRDIDTPESIVTSSSPECVIWDTVLPFPGLRVINEDSKEESEYGRMSPVVPVIAPIPIKLQAGMDLSIDKISSENNKENTITSEWKNKSKHILTPKDSNVTVTLTLSSSAAEDIMGVLRDLANILHIPPPTSYQIVERTTTPPSQKLGLYRTKGKDGKEGDPVDIQTILNGAAKFCRHCDVVILNTIIRAKACEFPLLSANNEFLNGSDDLYFCSKSCYKQFKWRPTNILDDSLHSVNSSAGNISKFDGKMSNAQFTIKTEKMDEDDEEMLKDLRLRGDLDVKSSVHNNVDNENCLKKYITHNAKVSNDLIPKTSRYKYFSHSLFASPQKYKKPTDKEITEMLFRMNITVTPAIKLPEDTRKCIFCSQSGDGVADGPSRLLNFDVDKWVHLNCALWSDGVYETVNGALMNLETALQGSLNQTCTLCHQLGATIKCFKNRCGNVYHLSCAIKDKCVFYKNKTTHCLVHALKNEKENELTTLSVQRRVYVDRDESRQVAAVMHHSELSNLLRVGSLIFLNVGQLLPHQLQAFHNSNYIYPIGYKIIRFYWSMRKPNKRCRYICSIGDDAGRPEFRVLIKEHSEQDIEFKDSTPKAVWQRILDPLALLRKNCELVQLFPKYVTGEDLFGLTEPAVVRILESLPGIETLTDYRFKYGRNPLLELPLAINPSGAARTEPKQKQALGWRKPHTQRSGSTNQRLPLTPTISVAGEVACPYSKQFVHSKSSQYKKMKQEWRNNVFLARSKIQGLGLYAARDLEKHTMVIEYIGEVIRKEVSELREKQYEAKNRGIYMFRLDEERVVDATLSGGLARYINHSCNPNCVTEIVEVDREYRIIIFAKRRINRGEELSYDYKFDIEDDAHKISCMCGAPNCRKWMN